VTSTLDGKRVLPHRLHWSASVTPSTTPVEKVEFLVDGDVTWVEEKPPYTFDDDGGYLVTSWIEPGERTFTVRVTSGDGSTAQDVVRARVATPPSPPGALAGTWARTVHDTSGAPAPGSAGNPTDTLTPAGTYRLSFDRVQAQTRFPGRFVQPDSDDTGHGWILDADYDASGRTLVARGGVTKAPFDGTTAEGGWWCTNAGPEATYDWSVSGDVLTLRPRGRDACGVRGFIWGGRWHRR
jgi:hypothetical protein